MNKERLSTFIDAMIAIIMTILVLELEKPAEINFWGFWELRNHYFAYALSFFWLGAMWVNLHNNWYHIKRINRYIIWAALLMLFSSSLFPYATSIVSENFNNGSAQVFYGLIVLMVTASNQFMYWLIGKENEKDTVTSTTLTSRNKWAKYDILIKILGILLSMTIFPSAMIYAVLFTLVVFVIPNQLKKP
ncbi:TMEM175 family protein [Fructilactobacillus vespulae]|uniref:TMEM175 family protein n=1 Tax=Fructilactobacillus vespulae TaxID=1249630 RepID=UPI0039B50A12